MALARAGDAQGLADDTDWEPPYGVTRARPRRAGKEVTLIRHGRPVAVVIRPDALRSRRAEGALLAVEQTRAALVALAALLGRLDLRPVDEAIASLAVALGASYRLRSADAVHLATAVAAGAELEPTSRGRGADVKAVLRKHQPDGAWSRDLQEVRALLELDVPR